ncbi:MAG: RNase adapter RapZ [Desulfobacterota bacterium]|nr:RNase adapter RapZ [Thermodesulfobacteriota bacterium]
MSKEISIVIISGISGSGKSTVLKTLEDLGFFCIDNLPVLLLPTFIELCKSSSNEISRVGLVIDIRERTFLKEYQPTIANLRASGHHIDIIFLECSNETLLQRFSETRRQHPLHNGKSIHDDIARERDMLTHVRASADKIIDTSHLNVHELRQLIEDYFKCIARRTMSITFMSFGYKFGIPHEADIVQDVRFLPNPYFVPELKSLDGRDVRVKNYIWARYESEQFINRFIDMLMFLIPLFEREGKSYLTIAIGCTGGRHRSVAIVDKLFDVFSQKRQNIFTVHRDLDRIA